MMKRIQTTRPRSPFPALCLLAALCLQTTLPGCAAVRAATPGAQDTSDSYDAEVAAFDAADRAQPPPPHPIVFVGSSSFTIWKSLSADMAPLPVLNRGFGGSQLSNVLDHLNATVLRYHPRAVVLYAGDNDLDAGTGKTTADVVRDFQTFVSRVEAAEPEARIYFVSIKPSRLRWDRWTWQKEANERIAKLCAADPRCGYIDVATPMLREGQPPPAALFLGDGMHMTARGYALWIGLIRPRLLRDFP